jgi:hypothetical protein
MQFQAEPCEPLAQLDKEPLGFKTMLESHDKVVSKSDDHYVINTGQEVSQFQR